MDLVTDFVIGKMQVLIGACGCCEVGQGGKRVQHDKPATTSCSSWDRWGSRLSVQTDDIVPELYPRVADFLVFP